METWNFRSIPISSHSKLRNLLMNETDMPNLTKQPLVEVMDSLSPGVRVFKAGDLFGPAKEIGIAHDGAVYRLRVTRAGKLILTK